MREPIRRRGRAKPMAIELRTRDRQEKRIAKIDARPRS